jgi:NAD(P)-dependent dehydrogenase (short-subunit alcohol dehydrogenase family)
MPTAVVTGAASGIGRATAGLLLAEGATIVGVDLAEPPEELRDALWAQGDVASAETWQRVLELAPEPERLIACAADIVVSPFAETPLADWRRIFDVNVFGVVAALHALLPGMVGRGRGAVAVVCSVNSLFVEEDMSAYSTSKGALLQLVRSVALEHARDGLRINAVCPGIVDTPLLRRHFETLDDPEAARRGAERRTPTGRLLDPREVAEVLCFLTSERASGMSGAAVVVDGGLTTAYDYPA